MLGLNLFHNMYHLLMMIGLTVCLASYNQCQMNVENLRHMDERRTYRSEPVLSIEEYLFLEEHFNENGEVVRKITFDADGNVIAKESFSYSDENRMLEYRKEIDTGIELKKYSYELDQASKKIQKVYIKSEDSLETINYKYEEDGSHWESHYREDELLKNSHINPKGLLIEAYDFFAGTNSSFSYDNQGELIYSEIRYGQGDFVETKTYELQYGEDQKVIQRAEMESGKVIRYEYDDQKRLTTRTTVSKGGEILQIFRYEYDR